MDVVEGFAELLRTAQPPDGLLAPDVFCDLNVPAWRFQLQGAESLAQWCKSEAPDGSDVTVGRVRSAGATTAVETVMVTGRSYSRTSGCSAPTTPDSWTRWSSTAPGRGTPRPGSGRRARRR